MNATKLAEALGMSKSAVSQLKKKGMPVTTLEEAQTWRAANCATIRAKRERFEKPAGHESDQTTIEEPQHKIGKTWDNGEREEDESDNPYDALRAAKEAEKISRNQLRELAQLSTRDAVELDRAQRTFGFAQRHRMWMEKEVRQWKRENGITLYLEEAKKIFGTSMNSLERLLKIMPRNLAARCVSPETSERYIKEYCERIRKAMQHDLFM